MLTRDRKHLLLIIGLVVTVALVAWLSFAGFLVCDLASPGAQLRPIPADVHGAHDGEPYYFAGPGAE